MDDIFSWCKEGNAIQVRIWLDEPTNDINQGDDHGFGPLHWASLAGHSGLMEILLFRGAKINAVNLGLDTPLHLAASFGHYNAVDLLLRNNANPNATNEHHNTPVHYACFFNYMSCVELLVKASPSSLSIKNAQGRYPIQLAHSEVQHKLNKLISSSNFNLSASYKSFADDNNKLQRTTDAALSRQPEVPLSDLCLEVQLLPKVRETNHQYQQQQQQQQTGKKSTETWLGTWTKHNNAPIVAKFIKPQVNLIARDRAKHNFNEEYRKLRIFSHPNILPVLAVSNELHNMVLISQHMPLGSLYDLLHVSQASSKAPTLNYGQTIQFALDIARGMAFLHSLNKQLAPKLHLNSSHIIIDNTDPSRLCARINMAHAKLSFIDKNKLYKPAWCSPEALQKKESDVNLQAADVWSYAIVLWELGTRQVPFGGMSALEVGIKIALEELRVLIPTSMPSHLARLSKICMNEEPGKRPNFDQVIPILTKMVAVAG